MARFLSVALDDGTTVLFETAESGLAEKRSVTADARDVEPWPGRLESIADQAGALCSALRKRLAPDEVSLELGATLSGEVGWFIAKSSLEAAVKITVTWKAPRDMAVA
ncbi:MAG: hypothetical protein FWC46_09735 [Actinomycetia bacterium]|nr:hypothetical protein [Actinomycetes bacterium]